MPTNEAAADAAPSGAGTSGADWQTDERSYIFEERLVAGAEHKEAGNEHFRLGQRELALRRYERAIYHAELDQMQQFDLMDKHRAQLHDVIVPVKLNYVACMLKIREAGAAIEPAKPEGEGEEENYDTLDRCEVVLNECLKMDPKCGKALFRRGQVLIERGDLPGAAEALKEAEKLVGKSSSVREAQLRVQQLQREERHRERQLFSKIIQPKSAFQQQEAVATRRAERTALVRRVFAVVFFPLIWPTQRIWAAASYCALLLLTWRRKAEPKAHAD
jgi:tetratricopeptide (TPR) repeat protein